MDNSQGESSAAMGEPPEDISAQVDAIRARLAGLGLSELETRLFILRFFNVPYAEAAAILGYAEKYLQAVASGYRKKLGFPTPTQKGGSEQRFLLQAGPHSLVVR